MRVQAQNIAKPDLFGIIEPFRPVIDGIELKENPIQFIQNGGLSGEKEIIIGTDIEEMIYVPAYIPDRLNITKKRYEVIYSVNITRNVGLNMSIYNILRKLNSFYYFISSANLFNRNHVRENVNLNIYLFI